MQLQNQTLMLVDVRGRLCGTQIITDWVGINENVAKDADS